ncbi:MAG: hypothetical protein K2N33_05080 [Clostridia bacterium]|nr:hypothetical protein [Clostridia bacterium]
MKKFSVEFCLADSEYMTALRLVAGAVCSAADVDVDTLEDFKVCVTESALLLKNCGFESVKADFMTDGGVQAEVSGLGGKAKAGETELSLALIRALVKECDINCNGGIIDRVLLKI